MSRYQFIVSERAHYSVRLLCRALDVSPSGFYDWLSRSPSDHEVTDGALTSLIRHIFTQSKRRYGSPRVHAELREVHGIRVSRKRVERLMREAGLAARRRRRRSLTKANPAARPAPDLVGRDFTAERPGMKLVGDITYLPTVEGWLYLATVLDLATRKLIGYSMAGHMRAELTIDAITMAASHSQLEPGCIFHTDQGSQGGFNWSSQHLVNTEVLDGATSAGSGSGSSPGVAFTWPADPGEACGARVLAPDRARHPQRGCRGQSRRVSAGRDALVSSRWRHAAVELGRGDRPISVVQGT